MMNDVYAKLKELGLELPKAPAKGGVYSSSRVFAGNLVYISGCGPVIDSPVAGKVGKEYTKEEAQVFSRNSMLNVLAVLQLSLIHISTARRYLPWAPTIYRKIISSAI